jgi:hypothetical protein
MRARARAPDDGNNPPASVLLLFFSSSFRYFFAARALAHAHCVFHSSLPSLRCGKTPSCLPLIARLNASQLKRGVFRLGSLLFIVSYIRRFDGQRLMHVSTDESSVECRASEEKIVKAVAMFVAIN